MRGAERLLPSDVIDDDASERGGRVGGGHAGNHQGIGFGQEEDGAV